MHELEGMASQGLRPSGLAGWFMGSQRAASSSPDTDVNVEQIPKESAPSDEQWFSYAILVVYASETVCKENLNTC